MLICRLQSTRFKTDTLVLGEHILRMVAHQFSLIQTCAAGKSSESKNANMSLSLAGKP